MSFGIQFVVVFIDVWRIKVFSFSSFREQNVWDQANFGAMKGKRTLSYTSYTYYKGKKRRKGILDAPIST
jgi:hypothetical protein